MFRAAPGAKRNSTTSSLLYENCREARFATASLRWPSDNTPLGGKMDAGVKRSSSGVAQRTKLVANRRPRQLISRGARDGDCAAAAGPRPRSSGHSLYRGGCEFARCSRAPARVAIQPGTGPLQIARVRHARRIPEPHVARTLVHSRRDRDSRRSVRDPPRAIRDSPATICDSRRAIRDLLRDIRRSVARGRISFRAFPKSAAGGPHRVRRTWGADGCGLCGVPSVVR